MLRSMVLLIPLLLVALVQADDGQKANPKIQPGEIPDLVKKLGDPSFQVRESALKRLQNADLDLLPALRKALEEVEDADVQRKLNDIVGNLERNQYLSPTKVTLKIANLPVKEAIQKFSEATGYQFEAASGDMGENKLIELEFKDTLFWHAFEEFCNRAGLVFQEGYYGSNADAIRLEYGDSFPGVVHVSGPFRVSVRGFNYTRNIEFASRSLRSADAPASPIRRTESLTIRLGLTVEPKLPLLTCGQPIITEAFDDSGQPLTLPSQMQFFGARYYSGYRTFSQEVHANLQPAPGSKAIKLLRGTIPVTVVASQKPRIVIEKVMEAQGRTFEEGNVSLKIENISKNGQQITFRINLTDGAQQGKRDYSWINQLMQRLVLIDAKGNKWQCYGPSWDGNGFNGGANFSGSITYANNGKAGEPERMVYYDWHILSHSVPFEFQDLTLP
ncbi:MAG: hypothetical protein NZM31_00765 [Gemmatales bacterium]|nr:hypothetical protein [Gemmatales bacterium]MDW8385525.1 hypothetical protein [Gemmatales bacterium]